MKNKHYSTRQGQAQRGVVLAVALIMLVLITLLSVSAMRSTIMEERMASNSRNGNIAFQLAETALRQAEADLENTLEARVIAAAEVAGTPGTPGSIGGGNVTCVVKTGFDEPGNDSHWASGSPCESTAAELALAVGQRPPSYFFEFVHADSSLMMGGGTPSSVECFYRITARGYGPDQNSSVTLQTTYRFNACT